ncbi:hypothetical protein I6I10_07430 [Corynebacterium glucuronolyticum]|uniref:Uncharacterized protein n=1 Tax=Corynebacterium glucuronolyticum TaxID=39791 RepID=A0A7T4ECX9_9CORY|nr:hypothetical protein [Corynebacterium glucuronolyticum]QQB45311.1 hypothetical protein I6I10_07125 [Corynebacterium glucuronolyticum]QQB45367.1 hypothetical protein I6I10_07430 [Corynebacterium glucuronolyticum]WKD64016.1 hypothetical protein CGLUCO_08855 [Corynebacterium glucuronolyticum DSM 44120]SMB83511.1 hypothetical protein SAMN05660745_02665 [Corynebacterium glucuronolyticum]
MSTPLSDAVIWATLQPYTTDFSFARITATNGVRSTQNTRLTLPTGTNLVQVSWSGASRIQIQANADGHNQTTEIQAAISGTGRTKILRVPVTKEGYVNVTTYKNLQEEVDTTTGGITVYPTT